MSDFDDGMAVRRAVLGDEHVDGATVNEVTADFQELITRYAWGGVWTRPGLSRRDRSIGVLTALVAGRHFDELEFHLRAALRNGLTRDEIVEVLLQTAVYCGVPAANSAFAVASRVLPDPDPPRRAVLLPGPPTRRELRAPGPRRPGVSCGPVDSTPT